MFAEVYDVIRMRGEVEIRINEIHHGRQTDRTSCMSLLADRLRILASAGLANRLKARSCRFRAMPESNIWISIAHVLSAAVRQSLTESLVNAYAATEGRAKPTIGWHNTCYRTR